MTKAISPRSRKVRILATLGPASNTVEMIEQLFEAGADAFRVNMSHGDQASKVPVIEAIRSLEKRYGRPTTILADLQGPKLRVGKFAEGKVVLETGQQFTLDRDPDAGRRDPRRAAAPRDLRRRAPRCAAAARRRQDGAARHFGRAPTDWSRRVEVGGTLSNSKGLNVPDMVLPLAALTDKDRSDLSFAVEQGVDWIALSFVQRPEDLMEARRLIGGKAALLAKIEKPSAITRLEEIVEQCDGVMVARGDLGVELPPQSVPPLQKRIVETARRMGRPVIVATQMLESMIESPSPTRAEVSDVATAVYDGADAIMLSAESAAGKWPIESVAMMNSIADAVERDPAHGDRVHFTVTAPIRPPPTRWPKRRRTSPGPYRRSAIVCFTSSGSTARRIARERPTVPIMVLTPKIETARRSGLLWGSHAVHTRDVESFEEMVAKAKRMAMRQELAAAGDRIIVCAGVPFGTPGSTNVLHVVTILGDELKNYQGPEGG
jgi:pyruvate kinase